MAVAQIIIHKGTDVEFQRGMVSSFIKGLKAFLKMRLKPFGEKKSVSVWMENDEKITADKPTVHIYLVDDGPTTEDARRKLAKQITHRIEHKRENNVMMVQLVAYAKGGGTENRLSRNEDKDLQPFYLVGITGIGTEKTLIHPGQLGGSFAKTLELALKQTVYLAEEAKKAALHSQ